MKYEIVSSEDRELMHARNLFNENESRWSKQTIQIAIGPFLTSISLRDQTILFLEIS